MDKLDGDSENTSYGFNMKIMKLWKIGAAAS